MIKTITKIGNSKGIIFDAALLELAGLKVGDKVNVTVHQGGTITLTSDVVSIDPEQAKAKAAAMASMSDEEKRAEQIQSLQTRLSKARERLAKAEAENDANVDAFRAGVTKLEEKLQELA